MKEQTKRYTRSDGYTVTVRLFCIVGGLRDEWTVSVSANTGEQKEWNPLPNYRTAQNIFTSECAKASRLTR